MRLMLFAAAAVTSVALLAPAAFPQSNPSADQIIKALKPNSQSLMGGTRGIRPLEAAPPAPPRSVENAAAAPPISHAHAKPAARPATARAPAIDLNVQFATGSANLTPQAEATLDQLGKALSSPELANYRFEIVGHTDTVGSRAMNQTLSEHRAETVASYIEQHFGVAADRLRPSGVGESQPLVPTPPQTPEVRNRRVEVVNIGA